jgi:hypothetical protein
MDRTLAQPQVNLRLLRSDSLKFQPVANKKEGKEEDLRGNRHEKSLKQMRTKSRNMKRKRQEKTVTKGDIHREWR